MNRALSIAAIVLVGAALAFPQTVPTTINYQGRLTDNTPSQTPVDAVVPMTFSIWDSLSGGTQLWTETWNTPGVTVSGGIFSVILGSNGSSIPSSVFSSGTSRYLEIVVNGETLAPRQQLGSVGWSMQAENTETAQTANLATNLGCTDCVDAGEVQFDYAAGSSEGGAATDVACSGCVDDADASDNLSVNNGRLYAPSGGGNVGIGTTSPVRRLDVAGPFNTARFSTSNGGMLELVGSTTDDWGLALWSGEFRLVNSTNDFSSLSDQFAFNANEFRPWSNDTKNLGTSTRRWSSVFGVDADFSGSVGVGTSTPSEKLEVAGNIKANDVILAGASPTYKVQNVATPTDGADAATKEYVDAQAATLGRINYWRVRSTSAGYDGNMGGYAGAHAKCEAEFGAGAVMLSGSIVAAAYSGGPPIVQDGVDGSNGWWSYMRVEMSPGIAGATTATTGLPFAPKGWRCATNSVQCECYGWSSNTAGEYGSYLAQGNPIAVECDTTLPIICAIPQY